MTCGELQRVRYCLLNFLQDVRVRVSLLLRQRLQNPDGSFVIAANSQLFYGKTFQAYFYVSFDGVEQNCFSWYKKKSLKFVMTSAVLGEKEENFIWQTGPTQVCHSALGEISDVQEEAILQTSLEKIIHSWK